MDIVMNASMEPIYRRATADAREHQLPFELEETARAGLVRSGERLYLAHPRTKAPPPVKFDDFDAEGWVNKLFLGTGTPPSDPSWRVELVQQGLAVAKNLMPKATALTELPVQIVISLQSDPDHVDPECDFATGTLHLRLVRSAQDDLALGVDGFAQPVLIVTGTASSLVEVPPDAG